MQIEESAREIDVAVPLTQTSFPFERNRTPRSLTVAAPAGPGVFVHEGAREALERRLAGHFGQPVVVSITDNRRTMLSSDERGGLRRLRLHHMFLEADSFTLRALCRYLQRGDRGSSEVLGRFIEANRARIRAARPRASEYRTAGTCFDLREVFDAVNAAWFGGSVDAQVTWARRTRSRRRRGRHSIKLGTYCHDEKLIRIHPALDQAWIPRFFVEFIMFHEMLHHVVPAPTKNGRQCFHTPEFRRREKAFPGYERAIRWEQQNIHRLLLA